MYLAGQDFDLFGLLNDMRKDKKKIVLAAIAVFTFISLAFGVFGQFVIVMLMIAEIMLAFIIGEAGMTKFGIELVTFPTVLTGILFGPIPGAVFGATMLAIHFILSRNLGPYVVYCVPMMGIIGFMAGTAAVQGWFGGNIATIGIALSLFYNLVTGGIGSVTYSFFNELVWSGTNFTMNVVLFVKVAPIVLSLVM